MKTIDLTTSDLRLIEDHDLTEATIASQIKIMTNGIPWIDIQRACTLGDGITQIPDQDIERLIQRYTQAASEGRTMKFVPASGAASRMFKSLVTTYQASQHANQTTIPANETQTLQCLDAMTQFAFCDDLTTALLGQGLHLETLIRHKRYPEILKCLLTSSGLNYAQRPKALIPFHRYQDHARTPLEEQLVEATKYTRTQQSIARIHFTVSPEHQERVSEYVNEVNPRYEDDGTQFDISYSCQKPSTDTIAVTEDNEPFRDNSGSLVLRPAGHGALLENLNDLQGDIVFIKNIDNVVPDRLKNETYRYKKALGGLLVTVQEELFGFLRQLHTGQVEDALLKQMLEWGRHTFAITLPPTIEPGTSRERIEFLQRKFNRPIRVCGMVRNAKEPGGGPFWVQHDDGTHSIQIVELSQIDPGSSDAQRVIETATHFNPVDLVCGLRDYQGKSFDLRQFVDHNAGIMTTKSHEGRTLKALELPGLWNGSMAYWNTIFVEVPAITFNPVKTVLDLLRPEHQ